MKLFISCLNEGNPSHGIAVIIAKSIKDAIKTIKENNEICDYNWRTPIYLSPGSKSLGKISEVLAHSENIK